MSVINVKCSCGKIQGKTDNVNSKTGSRIVCCCRDCQSFSRYLDQDETTLDEYGGTEIFQMPVSYLEITDGNEHIACLRLSDKGLYRWYAKCCNTPIGNTLGAGAPFIGLIHNFMDNINTREEDLGKSRGHCLTKFAKKEVPQNIKGSPLAILRSIAKFIAWKLQGLNKPSNFFDNNGNPLAAPNVLSEEARNRLSDH